MLVWFSACLPMRASPEATRTALSLAFLVLYYIILYRAWQPSVPFQIVSDLHQFSPKLFTICRLHHLHFRVTKLVGTLLCIFDQGLRSTCFIATSQLDTYCLGMTITVNGLPGFLRFRSNVVANTPRVPFNIMSGTRRLQIAMWNVMYLQDNVQDNMGLPGLQWIPLLSLRGMSQIFR